MTWTKAQLQDVVRQRLADGLFIVVSNREPYLHRLEGEEIICQVPPGGMAPALDKVMRACGGLWVAHGSGEADRLVVDANDHVQVPPADPRYTLRRIWLSKEEEDGYYYGFANEGLWPLCHNAYKRPSFEQRDWEAYGAVNRKFAEAILGEVGERNAFVFLQDYHFALLSRFLRQPNIRTAQFWHIPWPNPEAFRICPWAEELLDGLLGNDLLGFHIRYHCQNFMDTIDRIIEARVDREHMGITRGGRVTLLRDFPISVDFDELSSEAASPAIEEEMRRLKRRHRLRQMSIGVGVDRLDYTKGIPERLKALDRLFDRHPELLEHLVFVEIAVPSREHIRAYQEVSEEVDELVNAINWKYQRGSWKPIIYLKGHIPPETVHAWYRLATFCVVSSLHDGMNLVCKEFIASRVDEDGVLILSRFAGASRELTDALLVNPYAIDEIASAMHQALTLSPADRQKRMRNLRAHVQEHNIYEWAGTILSELLKLEFQTA